MRSVFGVPDGKHTNGRPEEGQAAGEPNIPPDQIPRLLGAEKSTERQPEHHAEAPPRRGVVGLRHHRGVHSEAAKQRQEAEGERGPRSNWGLESPRADRVPRGAQEPL